MYKKEKRTVQCALSIGNNVLQVIASWSLMTVIRCSSRKIPVPKEQPIIYPIVNTDTKATNAFLYRFAI